MFYFCRDVTVMLDMKEKQSIAAQLFQCNFRCSFYGCYILHLTTDIYIYRCVRSLG